MNADGKRYPSDSLIDGWMDEEGFARILNALDECRAIEGDDTFVRYVDVYPSSEHCAQSPDGDGCFTIRVTRDITGSIEIPILFNKDYRIGRMCGVNCLAEDLILNETHDGRPYISVTTVSDSFRYKGGHILPPGSCRPPVLWIGLAPKDRDRLRAGSEG